MDKLGKYLRSLRLEKKLTLVEVNNKSGISISYVSDLEKGNRTSPHPNILKKLAEVYHVPLFKLFEAAGYLTRDGKPRIFSEKDDIEWAFNAVLMDPEFGRFINRGQAKFMSLDMKLELIRSYEKLTGKRLLSF